MITFKFHYILTPKTVVPTFSFIKNLTPKYFSQHKNIKCSLFFSEFLKPFLKTNLNFRS